jgi:hypothetical protein
MPFAWNVDEARTGRLTKLAPPEVNVATNTGLGSVTCLKLAVICNPLCSLLFPRSEIQHVLFSSKSKTFEKALPAAEKFHEGHGYVIQSTLRTVITEVLFIDWLETILLPRIFELRRRFDSDGLITLIVDRHSTLVMPRVITFYGTQNVILIRLVAHSSRLAQPLD